MLLPSTREGSVGFIDVLFRVKIIIPQPPLDQDSEIETRLKLILDC